MNPSFYSSIQIFHFSNACNTFYIHIVGRVDIFLKYLSSFVVSTIYIFNQFIPLRIKYSSMFCFSAFKRFFHSLDEISIKFTATIWKFKSFFHAYFVYILYRNENSRIYIYIYKRVEERLWRQLYLSRSNRGWNFLKFHIRIERIRVGMNSRRVHRSKYVKLKTLVDWLHRVQP